MVSCKRLFDIFLMCYLSTCLGLAFGINKPSAQPFIESPKTNNPPGLAASSTFYSLVVACYSIGELTGAILLGTLASSRLGVKWMLYIATIIGIVGSSFYSIATEDWMALVGRLLDGMWSGALNSGLRSYITKSTKKENIKQFITTVSFFSTFSSLAGAGIGGLLGDININYRGLRFDTFRAPGWVLLGLGVITLYLLLLFHDESKEMEQTEEIIDQDIQNNPYDNPSQEEMPLIKLKKKDKNGSEQWMCDVLPKGTSYTLVFVVIIAFFSFSVGWGTIETILTPLTRDTFGMSVTDTSIVFIVGSISNVVVYIVLFLVQRYYPKKASSLRICGCGFVLCIIGTIIWTDWSSIIYDDPCQKFTCTYSLTSTTLCLANQTSTYCLAYPGCIWMQNGLFGVCPDCPPVCRNPSRSLNVYQMYVGFTFLNVGFSIGRAGSSSIYSELLQGKSHGFLMGLLVSSGSIARIIAPLYSVFVYQVAQHTTYILMPSICGLFMFSGILLTISNICGKKNPNLL